MKTIHLRRIVIVCTAFFLLACNPPKQQEVQNKYVNETRVKHPDWTKNAVIYEVNLRQHTPEGTLDAFAKDLPRLQEMGVDILWLMPIFPIGELNRKISQTVLIEELEDPAERQKYLGSYYSTSDYYSVNPEYGSMDDFKDLVEDAHAMGMYVILDIAANHTAWDCAWVTDHPEYYTKVSADSTPWKAEWMADHPEYFERISELGLTYPIDPSETDWWDVADLNYESNELRSEMINVFKYWVNNADIDGYRCDVAGWVPCDFWNDVRATLDSIKPVFMLAENEDEPCLLEEAFDMNYAWEQHFLLHDIIKGEKELADLHAYFEREDSVWDPSIYRMNFITNHDENSWKGTIEERYHRADEVAALLSFTIPGMPLLYSGQEAGLDKRLKFFEKDPIEWEDSKWQDFYTQLIQLKKDNEAFWNGTSGGSMTLIPQPVESYVFAFERSKEESRFIILANLGNEPGTVQLDEDFQGENFVEVFSKEEVDAGEEIHLKAYGYKVLLVE